jgi:hypothetical protein
MNAHSTRFGLNLVLAGTVAQTVEIAIRAAVLPLDVQCPHRPAASVQRDPLQSLAVHGVWTASFR